jgi:hypothetical protein
MLHPDTSSTLPYEAGANNVLNYQICSALNCNVMELNKIRIHLLLFSLYYYELTVCCLKLMNRKLHSWYRPSSAARTVISEESVCLLKPTCCTNFSNLFLEWKSTCFGQLFCPSSGVFNCTHSNGICHTVLQTACEQDQNVLSWSCSQAVCRTVWHTPFLCVEWKTPDDGQKNYPKHVEFHSKNIYK